MTSEPNGPEWWLASDGKWYPPESHLNFRLGPPPPPPPPPPHAQGQMVYAKVGSSQATVDVLGRPLASFGKRVGATLIDGIIVGGVMMVLFFAVMLPIFYALVRPKESQIAIGLFIFGWFVLLLLQLLVGAAYHVFSIARWGQTLGNRAVGTKVVRFVDGGDVTTGAAFGRYGMTLLLTLTQIGLLLDGLWVLWDEQQQTLHDKVANTAVIVLT